jgi:hypothetical protein
MAAPVGDCAGTPVDAVVELSAPFTDWAQITCTSYGHVIEARDGWAWSQPGSYAPVFIPSQMVRNKPEEVGNKSYFTKIVLSKVEGDEFAKAYEAYHGGLDQDKAMPMGYRLDLKSVSGRGLTLYFFDYHSFAWGIWCNNGCDSTSRFMLLNMAAKPND